MSDTVTIEINGQPFEAPKGAMVIQVADEAGIDIPRFCYHKKLSVAANSVPEAAALVAAHSRIMSGRTSARGPFWLSWAISALILRSSCAEIST